MKIFIMSEYDVRYFNFRIYTSDVPHSSVVHPTCNYIGNYPYLPEMLPGRERKDHHRTVQRLTFVQRRAPSDSQLEPISIHEDILTHLISYAPASWYTVSKYCKKVATSSILKSNHIREQWYNGAIFMKAAHENKPEILNIFLNAKWKLSDKILNCARGKEVVTKLLEYEYMKDLIAEHNLVLSYLSIAPDEIIKYFDIKLYMNRLDDGSYEYAYDYLYGAGRHDLIDRFYTRDELNNLVRYYMSVIDYIHGIGTQESITEIPYDIDEYTFDIVYICREYVKSQDAKHELMGRLIHVLHLLDPVSASTGAFCWYVEDGNVEGLKACLQNGVPLETVCKMPVSINDITPEVLNVLRTYLFSQTNYSHITPHIWTYRRQENEDLFDHFAKHGYKSPKNMLVLLDQ